MSQIQPIKKNNITEQIVDSLQNYILSERLAPGTRLPTDRELVTMLGCSRTVVREALKTLQALGLISIEQGKGTFVTERSWETVAAKFSHMVNEYENALEIVEARAAIEVAMIALAVNKATDDQITELEKIARLFYIADPDVTANDVDVRFHQYIMEMANNSILSSMREMTREFFRCFPGHNEKTAGDGDEHMAIVEAIRHRDAAQAKALIEHHVLHYRSFLPEEITNSEKLSQSTEVYSEKYYKQRR